MHKIFTKIILLIFFYLSSLLSQVITFEKTFGGTSSDVVNSIKMTSDNGYILAGYTYSFGTGGKDIYVVKTNFLGDTLWTKTYGDTLNDDVGDIIETKNGNYLMCGTFLGKNRIIKINENGDTLWTKIIPGSFNQIISIENKEEYILCGTKKYEPYSYTSLCLLKINSYGDTLWFRTYDVPSDPPGQAGSDGFSVVQTADNGFIASGSYLIYGEGTDGYIIKVDSLGNKESERRDYPAYFLNLAKTNDGNFIGGGHNYYTHYSYFNYIKFNSSLGFIWDRSLSQLDVTTYCNTVTVCKGNNYAFAGTRFYGGFFIKTDANGNTIWSKKYPSMDYIKSMQQTKDRGFILAGITNSIPSDICLIKTDSLGYFQPQTSISNSNEIIKQFTLFQNYPNPFNPTTTIKYSLSKPLNVLLKIYNIVGQEIKTLVDKRQNSGCHSVIWNAEELPSGIYYYQLIAGDNFTQTKKLILIK